MTSEMPEFMREDEHAGKEQIMRDDPDIWEARALLYRRYKDDRDRFSQMVYSAYFRGSRTVAEWNSVASGYPEPSLVKVEGEKLTKSYNEDIPVRAFILREAILRLFELSGAPVSMASDLCVLLDRYTPNTADKKAFVQALRLANPGATWRDICALAEADYSQTMKDKKEGTIVENPHDVGSASI